MKKLIILLFIFLSLAGYGEGIKFMNGNWAAVKAAAKAQNKIIFIDFYTDWCAPCKMMAQTIFPQKAVGEFYNEHFISVQVNAEKGEGIELRKKYSIGAYPTMIFTNDKEEVVYRAIGSSNAEDFIAQGKLAVSAPNKQFEDFKARYAHHDLDGEELYKFYLQVNAKGDHNLAKEVFGQYFDKAAAVNETVFKRISGNISDPKSKAFQYVLDNRIGFSEAAGKEKVDAYINRTLINAVEYENYPTDEGYQEAKAQLKRQVSLTAEEELKIDNNHYCQVKDKDRYLESGKRLATIYYERKADFELSNMIGGSVRFDLNKEEWQVVRDWAEHALLFKDNALNSASLAIVYEKMKDKEKALFYINKALDDCKRDNETYGSRIEMFKKEIENANYQ